MSKVLKKKKAAKKKIQKKAAKKSVKAKKYAQEGPIGEVTHYYSGLGVAVVKFNKSTKIGTRVLFKGKTTSFSQTIESIQYNHKPITVAPQGKEVGVKVEDRVREGDYVYLAD
jgi:hypothetical protein